MNVDAKMEVGVEDHGGKAAPSPSAAASAPPHFLCPVSMELMKDPVMVATGHTYDRPSIKRWLEQGHKTCPVTGSRLRNLDLLPNFALRSAISEWAAANNVKLNDRQLTSVTEKAVGGHRRRVRRADQPPLRARGPRGDRLGGGGDGWAPV